MISTDRFLLVEGTLSFVSLVILVSIFASASTESRICREQNNLVSGRTLYLILSPSRNLLPIASLIDKHFPEYNNNIE